MQPCPRQTHEAVLPAQRQHVSHWREDGTCSYCGSISPDRLFQAIEDGAELGPTDKSYKVYVELKNEDAGRPHIYSSANFEQTGAGWIQITEDNRADLPLSEWQYKNWKVGHWVKVEPKHANFQGKFYFQHLSSEGQVKFLELMNAKKLTIGYPGYFYKTPYFITYDKPTPKTE